MGWGNHYDLPWKTLDTDLVRLACAEVLRRWPTLRLEIKPEGSNRLSCFFFVNVAQAREWERQGSLRTSYEEFDRTMAQYGYGPDDQIPVHIEFDCGDGVADGTACEFGFETTWSGNGFVPNAAVDIAEAIAKFFGVDCKPN